jgi:hypothetical protein
MSSPYHLKPSKYYTLEGFLLYMGSHTKGLPCSKKNNLQIFEDLFAESK